MGDCWGRLNLSQNLKGPHSSPFCIPFLLNSSYPSTPAFLRPIHSSLLRTVRWCSDNKFKQHFLSFFYYYNLASLPHRRPQDRVVVLSNVYLDKQETLDSLATLFTGGAVGWVRRGR